MQSIKILITVFIVTFATSGASATGIQFNVTNGIVCQLEGPCQTNDQAFFDLAPTAFTGNIQADGTFVITDTISLLFDNNNQFITLDVVAQC